LKGPRKPRDDLKRGEHITDELSEAMQAITMNFGASSQDISLSETPSN